METGPREGASLKFGWTQLDKMRWCIKEGEGGLEANSEAVGLGTYVAAVS